jgi:RNA polymerase sigma factor (TIGR02999 family)
MEAEYNIEAIRSLNAESAAIAVLYSDLLRIGKSHLRREPLRDSWSPECLVHEAYIRILERYGRAWAERENVLVLWRFVMRNVLIDSARSFRAQKRNRGRLLPLADYHAFAKPNTFDLAIRINLAMDRMQSKDPQLCELLRMRFTDGMTNDEIADSLKISVRTVRRRLRITRRELSAGLV